MENLPNNFPHMQFLTEIFRPTTNMEGIYGNKKAAKRTLAPCGLPVSACPLPSCHRPLPTNRWRQPSDQQTHPKRI